MILADEPTGNLDTKTGADVIELLAGLAAQRGSTVVVATHDAGLAVAGAAPDRDARRPDGHRGSRGAAPGCDRNRGRTRRVEATGARWAAGTGGMTMRSSTVGLAVGAFLLAGLGAVAGAGAVRVVLVGHDDDGRRRLPIVARHAGRLGAALGGDEIFRRASPGVVEIMVVQIERSPFFDDNRPQTVQTEGSGFVYDDKGDIVTNEHVAGGAKSITVRFSDNRTLQGAPRREGRRRPTSP